MYRDPVPQSYEATEQESKRDFAYTARMMRRPECLSCGEHIFTGSYLSMDDMHICGIKGYICENCLKSNTYYSYELDDFDE